MRTQKQSQYPIIKSVWQDSGVCLRVFGFLPVGYGLLRRYVKIELPHDLDHLGFFFFTDDLQNSFTTEGTKEYFLLYR